MSVLPFLLVYTLPLVFVLGMWLGGVWTFLPVVYGFVAIPIAEPLFGHDAIDSDASQSSSGRFDWVLWGWVPVQIGVGVVALWRVIDGDLGTAEWLGMVLSTGIISGAGGINVAHELMHRRPRLHRGLAEVLMITVSYAHFCVEHVHGHHRQVATPRDPATSRFGESVYAFFPRTLFGGLVSAWQIETARVAKRSIGWGSLRDRRVRYTVSTVLLYGLVGAWAGAAGVAFLAAQSLVAVLLLESINYVEHYGLMRQEVSPGRFERTRPCHSWNATHRLTNAFLFNLQRHADHHAYAHRPYPALRACPSAPELPFGYPTMVLVSLVPPLWFAMMDPRVRAVRAGEARPVS